MAKKKRPCPKPKPHRTPKQEPRSGHGFGRITIPPDVKIVRFPKAIE